MKSIYTKEQIMSFLPHRYPFLFIDEVYEVLAPKGLQGAIKSSNDLVGGMVRCGYYVDPKHIIFQGHFPDYPILPGVIQVEMMAQACSFLTLLASEKDINEIALETTLLGIDRTKFRKPIFPGDQLEIICEQKKSRSGILIFDSMIKIKENIHSETQIMASLKF